MMSFLRFFRALVIVSIAMYFIWLLLPIIPIERSDIILDLLSYQYYGAHPYIQEPIFYIGIAALKLIASIGLFFFLPWGRWLFIFVLLISLAVIPFSGVSVLEPLDGLIGAILGLVDGAIVALSFSSALPTCQHLN